MLTLFFFKQKTAYEMRISDWSSDVCSSDLAEIMVGELEVIFRIDTITLRLRVTCQVLVLFKKLGSVAARTVIDAITRISAPAITLRARVVPTATAAGLTIIDQRRVLVSITS